MWPLEDKLSADTFERNGFDMQDAGLIVELGPWQCHLFRVSAV